MRRITIRLLGPFEVTIDGATVTTFEYAKVRALLAYLAVEFHRSHSRAEFATLLWADQPERAARVSLSQALMTLRNALGDKTADLPVLLSDAQRVQLDPHSAVEVDVHSSSPSWRRQRHTRTGVGAPARPAPSAYTRRWACIGAISSLTFRSLTVRCSRSGPGCNANTCGNAR